MIGVFSSVEPPSLWSRVVGVAHPASWATWFRLTVAFDPSGRFPVALASFAICEPSAFPFVGVGQPASATVLRLLSVFPAGLYVSVPGEPAIVGLASWAAPPKSSPCAPRAPIAYACAASLLQSLASFVGVGQPLGSPIEPLPDVGSTKDDPLPFKGMIFVTDPSFGFLARARSAQIGGPDAISQCFQVSAYSGEPETPIL